MNKKLLQSIINREKKDIRKEGWKNARMVECLPAVINNESSGFNEGGEGWKSARIEECV